MQLGEQQHLSWVPVCDKKILSRGSNQVDSHFASFPIHVTLVPSLSDVWAALDTAAIVMHPGKTGRKRKQ